MTEENAAAAAVAAARQARDDDGRSEDARAPALITSSRSDTDGRSAHQTGERDASRPIQPPAQPPPGGNRFPLASPPYSDGVVIKILLLFIFISSRRLCRQQPRAPRRVQRATASAWRENVYARVYK